MAVILTAVIAAIALIFLGNMKQKSKTAPNEGPFVYRIPAKPEEAVTMATQTSALDCMICSFRMEGDSLYLFCSTNETYQFNNEIARFDASFQPESDGCILTLSSPASLSKLYKDAVGKIVERLDEYMVQKLDATCLHRDGPASLL